MSNLADMIEQYIRAMFDEAQQEQLELQRYELARLFNCVPSQINYVLSTRFTVDKGYMVESRRGGGGFIRIMRVALSPRPGTVLSRIYELIEDRISTKRAETLLERLAEERYINRDYAGRIRNVLYNELNGFPDELADYLRARMLRGILTVVIDD